MNPADHTAFIRANTRLRPVPLVPEIMLHVADESVPLWQKTEEELSTIGLPPPYWAFAWAGGQALARYLLDHRDIVTGQRVLDLGAGSGLVAIAAARSGAAPVIATDIEDFSESAIVLNAEANGVHVECLIADLLDDPVPLDHDDFGLHQPKIINVIDSNKLEHDVVRKPLRTFRHHALASRFDVILVGDLFYEQTTAARTLAFLQRQRAGGTQVLVGDPGRAYLPKQGLAKLAEYSVPVTRELEDTEIKRTSVFALTPD